MEASARPQAVVMAGRSDALVEGMGVEESAKPQAVGEAVEIANAPAMARGVAPAPVDAASIAVRPLADWSAVGEIAARWLPWVWIVGAPVTFVLLATGVVGAERLRRESRLVIDGPVAECSERLRESLSIGRQVAVAVCERVAAPVLVGIVRPMILLPPAALVGWSPEEIEMVLLHELAHVRRWDNLVNLLQRLVEAVLFFQPAVWLVSGWVRREREACCDAVVVGETQRPQAYAELLVALAAQLPRSVLFHPAAASAMAAGPLRGRIRRILGIHDDPMLVSGKSLGVVMSGLLLAATLVVLNLSTLSKAKEAVAGDKNTSESVAETLDQYRQVVVGYDLDFDSVFPDRPWTQYEAKRLLRYPTPQAWPDVLGHIDADAGEFREIRERPESKFQEVTGGNAFLVPLAWSVGTKDYATLLFLKGIAADAHVVAHSYTSFASFGPMAGDVLFKSYATALVDGELTGQITADSYFNLVVTGKFTGRIQTGSYAMVYLMSGLAGEMELKHSKVYIAGRTERKALARIGGAGKVFLEESDLATGEHRIGELAVTVKSGTAERLTTGGTEDKNRYQPAGAGNTSLTTDDLLKRDMQPSDKERIGFVARRKFIPTTENVIETRRYEIADTSRAVLDLDSVTAVLSADQSQPRPAWGFSWSHNFTKLKVIAPREGQEFIAALLKDALAPTAQIGADVDKANGTASIAVPDKFPKLEEQKTAFTTEGTEEKAAIQFVMGASRFDEGDKIAISRVRGTKSAFEPGGTYWIEGTYTLGSRERASLSAFVTAKNRGDGKTSIDKAQTMTVERGSGKFSLKLRMPYEGWPHVSFYPSDGGQSLGGVYFGTGDSVLAQWWDEKKLTTEGTESTEGNTEKTAGFDVGVTDTAAVFEVSAANPEEARSYALPLKNRDALLANFKWLRSGGMGIDMPFTYQVNKEHENGVEIAAARAAHEKFFAGYIKLFEEGLIAPVRTDVANPGKTETAGALTTESTEEKTEEKSPTAGLEESLAKKISFCVALFNAPGRTGDLKELYNQFADEGRTIYLYGFDIDPESSEGKRFHLTAESTCVVFKHGRETARLEGIESKDQLVQFVEAESPKKERPTEASNGPELVTKKYAIPSRFRDDVGQLRHLSSGSSRVTLDFNREWTELFLQAPSKVHEKLEQLFAATDKWREPEAVRERASQPVQSNEKSGEPRLVWRTAGLTLGPLEDLPKTLRQNNRQGVTVIAVAPGSPAAWAGIEPGEVLVDVGEFNAASLEELKTIVDMYWQRKPRPRRLGLLLHDGRRMRAAQLRMTTVGDITPADSSDDDSTADETSLVQNQAAQDGKAANAKSKFPTLEEQKLADLAWKRLGIELERIDADDVRRVRAFGYDGGLRVSAVESRPGWQPIQVGDVLVGLHVWPTTTLHEVAEILDREDLAELNPLKFYVVRRNPEAIDKSMVPADIVFTYRISVSSGESDASDSRRSSGRGGSGNAYEPIPIPPLTDQEKARLQEGGPLRLKFYYAPNSEPCRRGEERLAEIEAAFGDLVQIERINVVEQAAVAARQRVRVVPTTLLIWGDKEEARVSGAYTTSSLEKQLANLVREEGPPKGPTPSRPTIDPQPAMNPLVAAPAVTPQPATNLSRAEEATPPPIPLASEDKSRSAAAINRLVERKLAHDTNLEILQQELMSLEYQLNAQEANTKSGDTLESKRLRTLIAAKRTKIDAYLDQIQEVRANMKASKSSPSHDEKIQIERSPWESRAAYDERLGLARQAELRYDGRTFDEWRTAWQTELSTDRRIEAVKALSAFGASGHGKEAAEAIASIAGQYDWTSLGNNKSADELKEACLSALGCDDFASTAQRIPEADVVPAVVRAAKSENLESRRFAVWVLPGLARRNEEAARALSELSHDSDATIRSVAFRSQYRTPRNLIVDLQEDNRVREQLLSNDPRQVKIGIRKLVRDAEWWNGHGIEMKEGFGLYYLPELFPLLFAPDASVRKEARQSLRHVQAPLAGSLVDELMDVVNISQREEERLEAIRAIAVIGPRAERAMGRLKELLASADEATRIAAAAAIKMMVGKDQYQKPVADVLGEALGIEVVESNGVWGALPRKDFKGDLNAFNEFTEAVIKEQGQLFPDGKF